MAANFSLVVHREELQETQHKATVGAEEADILETSRAGKTELVCLSPPNWRGRVNILKFALLNP